jgi:PEGA domain
VADGEAPLRIDSTPPGATIVVDGRERGRTPATVGVTPGGHELLLRRDGALNGRRRVAHLQEAARPEVPRQRCGADMWRSLGGEQGGPFLGVLDRCSAAEAQPVAGSEDPAPEPGPQRIEIDARRLDAAPGAVASV